MDLKSLPHFHELLYSVLGGLGFAFFFIKHHSNAAYTTGHEDIRVVPQTRSSSLLLVVIGKGHVKKDHLRNSPKCKPLKAEKNRLPRSSHNRHWISLSTSFPGLP